MYQRSMLVCVFAVFLWRRTDYKKIIIMDTSFLISNGISDPSVDHDHADHEDDEQDACVDDEAPWVELCP